MRNGLIRWASVVWAAAVALIFTAPVAGREAAEAAPWVPAVIMRAPAYEWAYPSIICSFRISGNEPPCARGIFAFPYSSTVYGIFNEGPQRHSVRAFTSTGSLLATYPMPGGVILGDADFPAGGSGGDLAVVDVGSHELKAYGITGSFYGVIRTLPSDVVAYARGGHVTSYLYLGTASGVISRYSPTWSFLNSFGTGVPTGDLAAGHGYGGMWGDWVILGPSRAPTALRAYRATGSLYGTFAFPGNASRGAIYGGGYRTTMCSLRDMGTEMWVYMIETGGLMPVEPASLGKVKALFK
jgi:hypothetical protein